MIFLDFWRFFTILGSNFMISLFSRPKKSCKKVFTLKNHVETLSISIRAFLEKFSRDVAFFSFCRFQRKASLPTSQNPKNHVFWHFLTFFDVFWRFFTFFWRFLRSWFLVFHYFHVRKKVAKKFLLWKIMLKHYL